MNEDDSVENGPRSPLESLRPDPSELVYRDELTGLYNRHLLSRLFDEVWDELVKLCDRFSFIMIDLDLFKEVNDRYGHLSGDRVLRDTASLLHDHFRSSDFIFRYGGDEFLILLPCAGREESDRLAGRARRAIREHEFFTHEEGEKVEIPLTFSVGVASYPSDGETAQALIAHADRLLYEEKMRARRRHRSRWRILSGVAAGLALASFAIFFAMTRPDAPSSARPPDAYRPVEVEEVSAERMLLLERIDELENRILELQQPRDEPDSGESPTDEKDGEELETLREEVQRLTAQLEAARPSSEKINPPLSTPPQAASIGESAPRPLLPPLLRESTPAPRVEERRSPSQEVARPDSIEPPSLLEPIRPSYPSVAQRLGKEARIELIVRVDRDGKVLHVRTVGPIVGFGFEEAAINAAMRSSWAPGTRNGQPALMETGLRVTFRMPE